MRPTPYNSRTPITVTSTDALRRSWLALLVVAVLAGLDHTWAQQPSAAGSVDAARISARIQALEREAARLASEARGILGDLQALEVERDLRREQAAQAELAARTSMSALRQASQRISDLEQRRVAELPSLQAQLVELYKHGRGASSRVLVQAANATDFARMARMVAAMGTLNERRVQDHRATLASLRTERSRLESQVEALQAADEQARQARAAAERAVNARTRLVADIDERRDLAAQYVGELQTAFTRLQQQVADLSSSARAEAAVPIGPFKGALDWPAPGALASAFGSASSRFGGTATRNGVEIDATLGAPVRAVHGGTVGFADVFPAYGRLVIVEHGADTYSLYGYLGEMLVKTGDRVEPGAELGRVGAAPAGPPALYFELRVDGQSTDPVEWLRPR